MADIIVQVIRKFSRYNIGEKLSVPEPTAQRWIDQRNVVRVPAETQAKAELAPPVNKMEEAAPVHRSVSVDDSGSGDDRAGQPRRGPGRPSRG